MSVLAEYNCVVRNIRKLFNDIMNFRLEIPSLSLKISVKRSTLNDPITQDIVEKCIHIATQAHEGQRDRDGNAVILHPLIVGSMGKTDAEKCVGFLHDVIEDTDWDLDTLEDQELPSEIIDALQLLTHEKGTDYYDYVQRIINSGNMTAINVKLNDLTHNLARGKAYGYEELVRKHEKAKSMIEEYLRSTGNE